VKEAGLFLATPQGSHSEAARARPSRATSHLPARERLHFCLFPQSSAHLLKSLAKALSWEGRRGSGRRFGTRLAQKLGPQTGHARLTGELNPWELQP
jgi:hypothetical protein